MKRLSRFATLFLLILSTFNHNLKIYACGPSFVEPVFAFETRPDEKLDAYARGNLGVVRADYNRTFLLAAYRRFDRLNFTPNEEKDLIAVWNAELYREDSNEVDTNTSVKTWLASRKKVLGGEAEPKIYTDRNYDGGFYFFPNCTASAFETAAQTLEKRISEHSAADENVKNWTRAQDQVFSNCAAGKQIPAETSQPTWLKNDRDYQIAAALFYATDFDEAKNRFEKIAADKSSPWSSTANYLVARTLIRQASTLEDSDYNYEHLREKRRPIYEQAEAQVQKILSDPTQKEFHSAAAKLSNLIKYRLHPAERLRELAAILSAKNLDDNFRQNLIDYRWLMDRYEEIAVAAAQKNEEERAKRENKEINYDSKASFTDYPTKAREDDLTDWILTFESDGEAAFKHSFEKWRAGNNRAWFVAAISKAEKNAVQTEQLLTEAARVEKSAPEFATVAFHRNRLLMEKGAGNEARRNLDAILNDKSLDFPVSARNQFLSQRMLLAETLDDFLTFATRRATAFSYDGSADLIEDFKQPEYSDDKIAIWRNRLMFDKDAARVFNDQMPLTVLKQAAASAKLPDYLRRNLLVATFTRAVALNNDATASEAATQLVRVAPEFETVLNQYSAAKTAPEKQSAATYALLKFPALRPFVEKGYGRTTIAVTEIDSYRDNWWCAPFDEKNADETVQTPPPAPTFLTAAQVAAANSEREQLKKLGGGSTYVARRAVEFAQKSPTDERVPESLHLAVRATRYGCQDCETGKWSRQAHDILKARFPRSEWTKKTPYWFKDESCETQK